MIHGFRPACLESWSNQAACLTQCESLACFVHPTIIVLRNDQPCISQPMLKQARNLLSRIFKQLFDLNMRMHLPCLHTQVHQNFPMHCWKKDPAAKNCDGPKMQRMVSGTACCMQVSAIDTCAREPVSKLQCSQIQGEFGEEPSSGILGKKFFGS